MYLKCPISVLWNHLSFPSHFLYVLISFRGVFSHLIFQDIIFQLCSLILSQVLVRLILFLYPLFHPICCLHLCLGHISEQSSVFLSVPLDCKIEAVLISMSISPPVPICYSALQSFVLDLWLVLRCIACNSQWITITLSCQARGGSVFVPDSGPTSYLGKTCIWDGQANKHLVSQSSDEHQDFEEVGVKAKYPLYWYCQRQTTGPDNT